MLALMLGVIVVMAGATYTRFYFVSWLGERVTADLRRAVFDHLLRAAAGFFEVDAHRRGDLAPHQRHDDARDGDRLERVDGGAQPAADGRRPRRCWRSRASKLTLLVLAGVPLVVAPIVLFGRRVRKLARASQDRVGDVGALRRRGAARDPHRAGLRPRGARPRAISASASRRRSPPRVARIRQRALLVAAVIVLVFGAVGVILWIGGHDVVAGRLSAGQLSAFVFYAVHRRGRRRHDQRGDRRPAARRRRHRAAVRAARRRAGDPRARASGAAARAGARHRRVRRRDVPLSVAARHARARRFLARRVAPARSVALVGPSGAGKTTVFQLLLRFYDPQAGVVRIDGVDLRAADPRDVRRQLALVPQDPVIFAASVLENVRYGRPDASDAEVRAACEAAYATEFIERLPRGLRRVPRRARRAAVGRPAPAPRHRARDPRRPADPAARRGDERARRGERARWCSSRSSG